MALEMPAAAKDALAEVGERLRPSVPDARWVPRENLHATMSFLGEVPEERIPEVADALGVAVAGLVGGACRLGALGAFPSERRARVLWAGLADPVGLVTAAADAVAGALEEVGFPREERGFHAHVTLARLRTPASLRGLAEVAVPDIRVPVERIALYRSRPRRPAPIYEALAVFPFPARGS